VRHCRKATERPAERTWLGRVGSRHGILMVPSNGQPGATCCRLVKER
jgi:hypothetical protein